MMFGVDRIRLGELRPGQAADLTHQDRTIPLGLPFDLRRIVLHLLPVERQPRRAAVLAGQNDHVVGPNDRQVVRCVRDVAQGAAQTRHLVGIEVAARASASAATAASASKTTTAESATAPAATATTAAAPIAAAVR